jgi:Spy/CpxP family protein refolding chaperone
MGAAVIACLVATVASAMPPMKWWQDERIKAELRLSAEQSAKIEEVFQSSFPKLRASAEELKKREEQLSNLISGNGTTEADVLKQADQVEVIRGALNKARILMLYRMRQVLSPEQRLKLQAIQRERERSPRPENERR